jgi:hypothetical protein
VKRKDKIEAEQLAKKEKIEIASAGLCERIRKHRI